MRRCSVDSKRLCNYICICSHFRAHTYIVVLITSISPKQDDDTPKQQFGAANYLLQDVARLSACTNNRLLLQVEHNICIWVEK